MLPCQQNAVQFLPLTDLVALLGIGLVLCATSLRLVAGHVGMARWTGWWVLASLVFLWFPVGQANLPLLAYVRGITSDFSVTLVALACLVLSQHLFKVPPLARGNKNGLNAVIIIAASLLYPTALGWGDWDAYRLGWGSFSLLGVLLALVVAFLFNGSWLVPSLIGLALLAWVAELMESTNLWDYLIDPWLAVGAMIQCTMAGTQALITRYRRSPAAHRS